MSRDRTDRDVQLEEVARTVRGRFKTIEEVTQSFLREAILQGLYRPGERLPQDTIAALLGVSRMPVRSGLRQLEGEGLISVMPYKGAIVSVLTPEEIAEIYDLRTLVETYLLERAAPRLTPEVVLELEELASAADQADADRTERADRRLALYDRLYALAEAPWALKLAQQLRTAARRYVLIQRVDEGQESHAELIGLVKSGDMAQAKLWLVEHLAHVSQELRKLIVEHQPPAEED